MRFLLLCGALVVASPVLANDTTAQLGTGGLVFVTNDTIEMASEHLFISADEIKVVYAFNNTLDKPQTVLVAFPMPDVQGGPESMVDVPITYAEHAGIDGSDPNNLFGFKTTLNGTPVAAQLHQYAFHNNIDYSKMLEKLGIPLNPLGEATYSALNALTESQVKQLTHNGLVFGMEYDAGNGWQTDVTPMWTLRSTYSWEATFPPGVSEVVHTYHPSVGGTAGVTFMSEDDDGYSARQLANYRDKYCLEDNIVATLKRQAIDQDGWTAYPYAESWISYVWSTGNNWAGSIGKFTLTVDKGKEDSLISFCGEGVKKIGPTTFEMTQTDWYPPWDRELEILILNHVDWYDE